MFNETGAFTVKYGDLLEAFNEEEFYLSNVLFCVALLVVFFASCVANIVICIVISYNKTLHTATDYYLFDLAISDLLITFQILTIVYRNFSTNGNIVRYNGNGMITYQLSLCVEYIFLSLLFNHGILVMTALSIERYIAICYPFRLQRVPVWQRVVKVILVLWIIAIAVTLPMLWTFDIVDTEKGLQCFMPKTLHGQTITVSLGVITFFIPLSIMTFVYSMISFRVKNHEIYNLSHSMVNKSIRNGKNVTNLIMALMVSFIVCYLPHFLLKISMYFFEIKTKTDLELIVTLQRISMFNSWLTTVVNPLLFSLISVKFRKALKMLWSKKMKNRII